MQKFTFSPLHTGPALLAHTRESMEAVGCTCTVEVEFIGHHKFELHTLVCTEPKKEFPVKFTRAGEQP